MREEKTFRVVVFRFETDASTNYTRYMINRKLYAVFPWQPMARTEKHTKDEHWKGICKEACSVFELVGFKKGHIRKCDKSPCARVLT